MIDLADFLAARLDEAEAIARANVGDGGLADTESGGPGWPDYQTYDGEAMEAASAYLHQFRPLRMLRDVEAGRKLLHSLAHPDPLQGPEYAFGLRLAAMFRAEVYSDHPDYQPGWKP